VNDPAATAAVVATFRAESPRIVGALTRLLGDLSLAEDAASDAFAAALEAWPRTGVPDNPGAWLTTTARHRAIDALRRERVLAAKREALLRLSAFDPVAAPDAYDPPSVPDDRLALMFTCCHPALAMEARVALTLRMLGGLTTDEVARLFLVPVPTMAARITRAKKKISVAGIPFRVPDDDELPDRLTGVLAVVYLVFTEGWHRTPPSSDLCGEAVRLARLLADLMPDEPEALGLLALLLLQHSRSRARADGALLRDQDRSLWSAPLITEGAALAERALRRGRAGPYQVQAAIAAVHATAPTYDATDWPQIAALYRTLQDLDPSPVVALNAAVARAECGDVTGALADVESLSDALAAYHLFHATRADLLARLGRTAESRAAYERALDLATDPADRAFLSIRIDSA
jgi:RNA polymerase sigma-70 factor (ECF subfamily)